MVLNFEGVDDEDSDNDTLLVNMFDAKLMLYFSFPCLHRGCLFGQDSQFLTSKGPTKIR